MDRPPISVIVPTYNRAALLPAAIQSVQAQTRPDWELIIVDDGSTDGTSAAIAPLLREDRRLRLLANEGAPGPAGFLDSDDYWEPSKLARFMAEFGAVPAAVLIASDNRMVDRDSPSVTTMKSFLLETMVPWWQRDSLAREVTRCDALVCDIQTITQPGLFTGLTIAGFP